MKATIRIDIIGPWDGERALKARDLDDPTRVYRITLAAARGCPVRRSDGGRGRGLGRGQCYEIEAFVDQQAVPGDQPRYGLRPVTAKEIEPPPIDWENIPRLYVLPLKPSKFLVTAIAAANMSRDYYEADIDTEEPPL